MNLVREGIDITTCFWQKNDSKH